MLQCYNLKRSEMLRLNSISMEMSDTGHGGEEGRSWAGERGEEWGSRGGRGGCGRTTPNAAMMPGSGCPVHLVIPTSGTLG